MTRKHDLWKMADVEALTGCTQQRLSDLRKHRVLPIKGRWYSDEDVALIEIAQQLRAAGQKWRTMASACAMVNFAGARFEAVRVLALCPRTGMAWAGLSPDEIKARHAAKYPVLIWIDVETIFARLRKRMDARRVEMDSDSTQGRRGARVPNNSRTASSGAA